MNISETLLEYRKENKISQREVADQLHVDRSLLSKYETGKHALPVHHDANLSKLNWRMALSIIDERSGGYISNILDEVPNLDLTPASLKETLSCQIDELEEALRDTRMAKHIPIEKQKHKAEKLWMEMKDVVDYAALMLGVLEEEFDLDKKRLRLIHQMEVKQGKR